MQRREARPLGRVAMVARPRAARRVVTLDAAMPHAAQMRLAATTGALSGRRVKHVARELAAQKPARHVSSSVPQVGPGGRRNAVVSAPPVGVRRIEGRAAGPPGDEPAASGVIAPGWVVASRASAVASPAVSPVGVAEASVAVRAGLPGPVAATSAVVGPAGSAVAVLAGLVAAAASAVVVLADSVVMASAVVGPAGSAVAVPADLVAVAVLADSVAAVLGVVVLVDLVAVADPAGSAAVAASMVAEEVASTAAAATADLIENFGPSAGPAGGWQPPPSAVSMPRKGPASPPARSDACAVAAVVA